MEEMRKRNLKLGVKKVKTHDQLEMDKRDAKWESGKVLSHSLLNHLTELLRSGMNFAQSMKLTSSLGTNTNQDMEISFLDQISS